MITSETLEAAARVAQCASDRMQARSVYVLPPPGDENDAEPNARADVGQLESLQPTSADTLPLCAPMAPVPNTDQTGSGHSA